MIVQLRPGDEERLEAFLAAHRSTSMFLRSNLRRAGLAYAGQPYEAVWAAEYEGGEIRAVVAHAWNGLLLLQAPRGARELAGAVLRFSGRDAAGMVGPRAQVDDARGLFDRRPPPPLDEREDLFELDLEALVVPEPLARGDVRCRHALERDIDLLSAFRHDYRVETLHEAGPALRAASAEEVRRLVADGDMFVLESASTPVSCSAFNARLPDTVQVGGVWTPPALRGRGYARACVAGSLLLARASGVTRSILFTGVTQHAARRAYLSLGYRVVGDYAILLW